MILQPKSLMVMKGRRILRLRATCSDSEQKMSDRRDELSFLDQIRLVEADMARQLVVARESAEELLERTRALGEQRKIEARQAGLEAGQALYKNIVTRAADEAQTILAQTQQHADRMRGEASLRMEHAILSAINIVIGREEQDADR